MIQKKKKVWFVNQGDKDLFISLPGSHFAIKGYFQNNEVDAKAMHFRESWFLTLPKKHKPIKEDAITISDLGDFKYVENSFNILVSARAYKSSGEEIILGKYFTAKISMKVGKYNDLVDSSMRINKIDIEPPNK